MYLTKVVGNVVQSILKALYIRREKSLEVTSPSSALRESVSAIVLMYLRRISLLG